MRQTKWLTMPPEPCLVLVWKGGKKGTPLLITDLAQAGSPHVPTVGACLQHRLPSSGVTYVEEVLPSRYTDPSPFIGSLEDLLGASLMLLTGKLFGCSSTNWQLK